MIALAADIGGTYSRLAWSLGTDPAQASEQRFENAAFASLEAVIDEGLRLAGAAGQAIDHMVLAVPGPVGDDPIALTNIDWRIVRTALQRRYRAARLRIVNDFQAAALGALGAPSGWLTVLNAGHPGNGPAVVAGAGTGLGMAWLPSREQAGLPQATEGGHLDFAPTDERQLDLYRRLAARYGHVSYERLLSGDGLFEVYRLLAGEAARASGPAEIVALARLGDTSAEETLRTFVEVFAAYAGNLALAFNPTGGIYLCGGLTAHLADWFDPGTFAARFTAKGRMQAVVSRIPVFLVRRHDVGLAGARKILNDDIRAET